MQNDEPARSAKVIVTSFIEALNSRDQKSARRYVSDNFSVKAPQASYDTAEAYFKDVEKAQQTYNSRYDIKRVVADGNDVCVITDVIAGPSSSPASSACGWYRVEDQKIRSLRLMYESGPPGQQKSK
jgi:predicted SnoaL-like aldol condensation-catalyzing enzyme